MKKVHAKNTIEHKMDRLASAVNRGFMGMGRGFSAVADDIADIKSNMATKNDISDFPSKDEVRNVVHAELKDIRKQLESLEEASTSHYGFSKEIDHVLHRVTAIERHLGTKSETTV